MGDGLTETTLKYEREIFNLISNNDYKVKETRSSQDLFNLLKSMVNRRTDSYKTVAFFSEESTYLIDDEILEEYNSYDDFTRIDLEKIIFGKEKNNTKKNELVNHIMDYYLLLKEKNIYERKRSQIEVISHQNSNKVKPNSDNYRTLDVL